MTFGLVEPSVPQRYDVGGNVIQRLITSADGAALLRGHMPAGTFVPLHSHDELETFVMTEGALDGIVRAEEGEGRWEQVDSRDVFHVPAGVPHAFRNAHDIAALANIVTTARMADFFEEIGRPVASEDEANWPPAEAFLAHFLEVSDRYGFWNAGPEDNARIGIDLGGLK